MQLESKQSVRVLDGIDRTARKACRMPAMLHPQDNRFGVKAERVVVCNGCGNVVPFSSKKQELSTLELNVSLQDHLRTQRGQEFRGFFSAKHGKRGLLMQPGTVRSSARLL